MSGKFNLPIFASESQGGGGTEYNPWNPHEEWPDISDVNDNEINILVSDSAGSGIAFIVTTSFGTYSIDWGDGNIETGRVSGTTYQHQYVLDGGTSCSLGYTTFVLRIYGATGDITRLQFQQHSYIAINMSAQACPILWVVFGTTKITTYASTFYNSYIQCYQLQAVSIPSFQYCTSCEAVFTNCTSLFMVYLPDSWGSVTTCYTMFSGCKALLYVDFPTSWGSVKTIGRMFKGCKSLSAINLPESFGSITTCLETFKDCTSLSYVELPSSWGSITNVSSMFYGCLSLTDVTLPSTMGNITSCGSMFYGCNSLRRVTNLQYLGSDTNQTSMSDMFYNCEMITDAVVIGCRIADFGMRSQSGTYPNKVTSIRFTNANSLFNGSFTPSCYIAYCSLDANALDTLFGDLPTVTSETINITGNPGAATCTRSIATAKGWTISG